jgi:hypothetical protein
VLASFESPAPIAEGFDWNRISGTAMVGGVIGGLIGGMVAVARKLSSKPSSKQKNADTPEAGEL